MAAAPAGRLDERLNLKSAYFYELYRQASTDSSGMAQMGVPPGEYTAYAFENIEPNSWWDPELMRQYGGLGTPVRVDADGNHRLELKLIPPRR